MLVNSILGRPAATAGLTSDVDTILSDLEHSHTETDEMARLVASHQIVLIINGIVDGLYDKKDISTPVVESLLKEIEKWSQELPKCVKAPAKASTVPGEHMKGTIGSVHVSCLYYFAVTLVTRPILISTLTAPPASGALVHSQLASACLDAASFLVQACVDAKKANVLYGNMCIMK